MCGRFTLTVELSDLLLDLGIELDEDFRWTPRYNIAPSQGVLSLRGKEPRVFQELKWGLIPFWAKDEKIGYKMINARSETIDQKPSFRTSFKGKRCLIFADGFFEWTKRGNVKVPYHFSLKDGSPFMFAGLWDSWKNPDGEYINSCTIITCSANELVGKFHHRMPVILTKDHAIKWLDIDKPQELKQMVKPFPDDLMQGHEVSRFVNNPANDVEACVLPVFSS